MSRNRESARPTSRALRSSEVDQITHRAAGFPKLSLTRSDPQPVAIDQDRSYPIRGRRCRSARRSSFAAPPAPSDGETRHGDPCGGPIETPRHPPPPVPPPKEKTPPPPRSAPQPPHPPPPPHPPSGEVTSALAPPGCLVSCTGSPLRTPRCIAKGADALIAPLREARHRRLRHMRRHGSASLCIRSARSRARLGGPDAARASRCCQAGDPNDTAIITAVRSAYCNCAGRSPAHLVALEA